MTTPVSVLSASLLGLALASPAAAQVSSHKSVPNKPDLSAPKNAAPKGMSNASPTQNTMFVGPLGADDCSMAFPIAGTGSFNYDNSAATTGAEGQAEALCNFFGTTGIDNDIWFAWTAPMDGVASISTCGNTQDTKLAVYDGGGCPAGAAIACNDDTCALQSTVTFAATMGNVYTIQLGNYPGALPGAGSFTINVSVAAPNDDCAAAQNIVGTGTFPFDNTVASTGAQGQAEALCNFFGSTAIDNDVWFTWTAPMSGTGILDFCANGIDTKVAVYDGAGCPVGAAIACNDDSCGLQSRLQWPVTGGNTYTLQVGTYPGAAGGVGSFDLSVGMPPTNDDCTMPTTLMGLGNFAYDNLLATTGAQGQAETACNFFGATGIDNDVWFTWTATMDGTALVSTCGGLNDTKIAVYDGMGCPAAAAIACNDDSCGLQSTVAFDVTTGNTYTIQAGNYPGATGGAENLNIDIVQLVDCLSDDGTSENSLGLTGGGEAAWLHKYGNASSGAKTITSVSSAFGTAAFPGGTPGNGTMAMAYVWDDPNDDGDPSDAVLVDSAPITVMDVDTDMFNVAAVNANVNNVYFIGVSWSHSAGQFPAPIDENTPSLGRAWIVGDAVAFDPNNVGANSVAPAEMSSIGFDGVFLLRCNETPATGTPYCAGTNANCPCGNGGMNGAGCENSFGTGGGLLEATGNASVSGDTVVLSVSGLGPTAPGLYFQGENQQNVVFGDGLRCAGGTIRRLGTKTSAGGASSFGFGIGSDPLISVQGAVPPSGATRTYQTWYRNTQAFCTPAAFNLTNGIEIVWMP